MKANLKANWIEDNGRTSGLSSFTNRWMTDHLDDHLDEWLGRFETDQRHIQFYPKLTKRLTNKVQQISDFESFGIWGLESAVRNPRRRIEDLESEV